MRTIRRGGPLHVLIVSNTGHLPYVQGADRDWVSLLNAAGPDRLRVTWVGLEGSEHLRAEIDERVLSRALDVRHPCFYELTPDNSRLPRSRSRWGRLALRTAAGLGRSFVQLRRALRGTPIDLVVTNTSVVLLGALFARLTGRPHVWNVKEYLDPRVPACRRFAALICRASAAVVVPSRAIAEPFPSPVAVLPDGNDVQRIRASVTSGGRARSRSLGWPADLPIVVQVGAISERKGQHVLAQAFVKAASRGGAPAFGVVFLGWGGPADVGRVRRILADAPAPWRDAVRFAVFETGDFSLVDAADVVVHPSTFPDAFPNAVREAMILGKPVVAARVGGLPDMIADGETGLLVPPDDAEALGGAILRLIGDPERRRQLGARAATAAARDFDIDVRKVAYLDLFDRVCRASV